MSYLGKCDICSKRRILYNKIYWYNISCGCCSDEHAEACHHCEHCEPKAPERINAIMEPVKAGGLSPTAFTKWSKDAGKRLAEHKKNKKKIHGNIKCDCGHTAKDHYGGWGWCHDSTHPKAGKCGCTFYHPNVHYIRRKQKKDGVRESVI